MGWIHDVPAWILAPATMAICVGLALAGLGVTRRWTRGRGLHALIDNGVTGWIFSAILAIYAIAIGLIAVESWSNASEASGIVSREAARIAALYRDFGGYPKDVRAPLEGALVRYARSVVEEDWPAQRRGEIPRDGARILNEIERDLYVFEPRTDGQRVVHAEALGCFNRLVELRRERLEAVEYAVPGRLWGVVIVGAVLAIAASYVFSIESLGVHAVMTSLLAAMISLLVFFIAVTDLPFRGRTGVKPEAYELVLHDLERKRSEYGDPGP